MDHLDLREEQKTLADKGYHMEQLLGKGAFSKVLLVRPLWQNSSVRPLACKVSDRTDLALREAALLQRVDHPLFPEFCGMWQQGEKVYLLMEYICGSSLEEFLRRRGAFSSARTARVGMALAEGLRFLHQMSDFVLYRDLKPANVMIRQDGRVKLLDLGCACQKSDRDTTLAGTPGYAAPEQLNAGCRLTFACDVYSLGKTMEAMAGRNCQGELKQVILACTGQQPELRIPDMQGVMAALAPLCGEDTAKSSYVRQGGFLRSRTACIKNIWESNYKNF